ncbi:CcdB family protein [Tropicibacter sp. R15_0]|uniref:CcdB family protein n=1 Tax=Tropicibacter sp. R15_0 TaxID=2821101 RepID=UPI001ADCD904|nr:CcdB family protein [Tropicibacter sp. R15_0]
MEELKRFDVAEFNGVKMVVVESQYLPPDPAVVVIPLLENYPAVRLLNPSIQVDDTALILATRLITSVRRSALSYGGSVEGQGDEIIRAVDVLMGGF